MVTGIEEYTIRLDGIRFRAKHGVSDSERELPQDFLVAIEVSLPVVELPNGDHLRDVFDYDRLATLVVSVGTGNPCRLLETLAQRLVERIWQDTPATRVAISVTKGKPPTHVSVESATVSVVARRN